MNKQKKTFNTSCHLKLFLCRLALVALYVVVCAGGRVEVILGNENPKLTGRSLLMVEDYEKELTPRVTKSTKFCISESILVTNVLHHHGNHRDLLARFISTSQIQNYKKGGIKERGESGLPFRASTVTRSVYCTAIFASYIKRDMSLFVSRVLQFHDPPQCPKTLNGELCL